MNKKEAEIFIRKYTPLIIKDKNGNPQHPFRSVNAYEQVCKHLAEQLVKSNSVLGDVNLRTYSFDCWDMSGKLTTKKVTATCEDHAILKFEKENDGEFGYDPPYVS